MTKNTLGNELHIVRDDEIPLCEEGLRLRGTHNAQASPGASAQLNGGMRTGPGDDVNDVAFDAVVKVNVPGDGLHHQNLLDRGDRGDGSQGMLQALAVHNGHFLEFGGITKPYLEQEAVELRLWERIRAVEFDGVLGSHHEEGARNGPGFAVHGDLELLHAFQQARLRLGGAAVYLVGEDDVVKHRAGTKDEVPGLLVEDVDSGNIRGEDVRGELDAAKRAADRPGKRLRQRSLADSRDCLLYTSDAADE